MRFHASLFVASRLALALVLAALVVPAPGARAKSLLVKRNTADEERADLEPSVKKELGVESPDVAGGERDGLSSDDLTSDYPTTVMPDAKLDGSRHDDDEPNPASKSGMDESDSESRGDESALTTDAPRSGETIDAGALPRADDAEKQEAAGGSKSGADDDEGSRAESPSDNSKGDSETATNSEMPEGSRADDLEVSEGSKSGAADEAAIDDSRADEGASKGDTEAGEGSRTLRADDLETPNAKPDSKSAPDSLSDDSRVSKSALDDEDDRDLSKLDGILRSGVSDEGEGPLAADDEINIPLDQDSNTLSVAKKPSGKRPKHPVPHPRPYFTSPAPSASGDDGGDGDGVAVKPKTTKKPVQPKQPPLKKNPSTTKSPKKPADKVTTTKKPSKAKATSASSPKKGLAERPVGGGEFDLNPNNLKSLQVGDHVLVLVKSKAGKIVARLPNAA